MKSPRADAKLKNLPEEIRADLYARVTEPQDDRICEEHPLGRPWTLDEARDWLLRTHEVSAGMTALSEWRAWEKMRRELQRTESEVRELQDYLAANAEGLSAEDVMEIGNLMFINRSTRDGDAKTYKAIADIILRRGALAIDRRKIALLEEKAARLEAAEEKAKELKAGGGLSPETLEVIEKQLKLL